MNMHEGRSFSSAEPIENLTRKDAVIGYLKKKIEAERAQVTEYSSPKEKAKYYESEGELETALNDVIDGNEEKLEKYSHEMLQ